MIRLDDHDVCRCGHIRADHLAYELKAADMFGECRAAYESHGRKYPCECNAFWRAQAAQLCGVEKETK